MWYVRGLKEPRFVYDAESVAGMFGVLSEIPEIYGAKKASKLLGDYFCTGAMNETNFTGLWLVPHPESM